jgi:hypothetical protein
MRSVLVILLLAGVAILGGVALAALGLAGEMATFPGDWAPLDPGGLGAADIALARLPAALWGYNMQATEDALEAIAQAVDARDVEIATLRAELARLRGDRAGEGGAPAGPEIPGWPGGPGGRTAEPGPGPGPDWGGGLAGPGTWPGPGGGLAGPGPGPGPGGRTDGWASGSGLESRG